MDENFKKDIYKQNILDSIAINIIYLFSISFAMSFIIYFSKAQNASKEVIFIAVLIFLLIESRLLLLRNIFYEVPTLDIQNSWRSWPSVGMVVSLPLAFIYYLLRFRDVNMLGFKGTFVVMVLMKYNLLIPYWIRSREENDRYNDGLGRIRFDNEKPISSCVELVQPNSTKVDL